MRNIPGPEEPDRRVGVAITPEAKAEIRGFGARAAARIREKIRHVELVGWEQALQLKLVKDLGRIARGIFEIRVTGVGEAYRLMCFVARDGDGRWVVVTTCVAKSDLLGGG